MMRIGVSSVFPVMETRQPVWPARIHPVIDSIEQLISSSQSLATTRSRSDGEQSCEVTIARDRRGGKKLKLTWIWSWESMTVRVRLGHFVITDCKLPPQNHKTERFEGGDLPCHLYEVLMLSKFSFSFVLMICHKPFINAAGFLPVYRDLTHYKMLFVLTVGKMCR